MEYPQVIGSKSARRNEREKFLLSEKRWISGELRRCGPCNPTGVDFTSMRDKGYGTGVHRDEKFLRENVLPRLFFGKLKPSLQS